MPRRDWFQSFLRNPAESQRSPTLVRLTTRSRAVDHLPSKCFSIEGRGTEQLRTRNRLEPHFQAHAALSTWLFDAMQSRRSRQDLANDKTPSPSNWAATAFVSIPAFANSARISPGFEGEA